MRTRRLIDGMLAGGLIAFAGACNETRDTGAVTTEKEGGTSTTPTAEAVEERDNALVRVVNAMPGGAASIYAGDSLAFANVAYRSVTDWKEMPDDYFGFKVVNAGARSDDDALAENREKLGNGGHYTIISLPDDDGDADDDGTLRVLDDDLKPITSGKARVRFVHAVQGLDDELSVFVRGNDNALVDGVNFSREAGWNEEDPIRGTLEVRAEGSTRPLITIPNVNLEAGKSHTYILTGTPTKVEVIHFSDSVALDPDQDDGVPDDQAEKRQ
jgi:hypothetical protein